MPKRFARIWLEITEVRVERLQDISEQDAIAEEFDIPGVCPDAITEYAGLWDSINGKKYPWSSNPFVWVITFRRLL